MSNSLRPNGLQHTRLPCPSATPLAYADSCWLSRWCHPTISSIVNPLLFMRSTFPSTQNFSSESALSIRWTKYWVSAWASVLPMNIQGWFLLGLTGLTSLLPKGLSIIFSSTTFQKHWFFATELSLWSNSHITYMTTGKTIVLTIWTCVDKVMALLFNVLSRFVLSFIPRSKHLLISWLQLPSAVQHYITKKTPDYSFIFL